MADTFRCTLVTPERQVFEQDVTYASIPAWDGQMGLMHQRAPLLVKLGNGAMRLDDAAGKSHWYFVGEGFAQMRDDKLSLVVGAAVPAEEISVESAQAQLKEALARVALTDEEAARKTRDIERSRSMLSIHAHV
ncbi:MAG: F0F1 ATP synthase subunit epsilon [Planctomycetes bacterium]|nr:F0F1 ATP synthase subunit epsilon [Planctomycetota bacterium]